MYNRIHKFFSDNICFLQFGMRQKDSTVQTLISRTEKYYKNIDEGNIGCGIFVDLQKAFNRALWYTWFLLMTCLNLISQTENNMF